MKIILFGLLWLVQSAFGADPVLTEPARDHITESISETGHAIIIVGLSDPDDASLKPYD